MPRHMVALGFSKDGKRKPLHGDGHSGHTIASVEAKPSPQVQQARLQQEQDAVKSGCPGAFIHLTLTTNDNHPTPDLPSDLPSQEYLNPRAASSIRPGSPFPATIPSYDSQSFVTDHQQTWLTQPQPSRLPTPASSHDTQTHDSAADFVLFPSPTQRPCARVPATAHTDLNYHFGSPYNGHIQSLRQSSTQNHLVGSSTQNHLVGNLPGSSPVSSNGLHPGLHTPSASSPALSRQRTPHRPTVPLFPNNSTGTINQRQHTHRYFPSDTQDMDLFDFRSAGAEASASEVKDSLADFEIAVKNAAFAACQPSDGYETVSPNETILNSAATSGAWSNVPTPEDLLFDSPEVDFQNYDQDTFSNFTMFPPLYPEKEDAKAKPDIAGTLSPLQTSPALSHVAPAMSRSSSSGQTSSRGRASTHSGVSKRRTQPLSPIHVDTNDPIAMKRARNTLAARKSRLRRTQRVEDLMAENQQLKEEIEMWKARAEALGYPGH